MHTCIYSITYLGLATGMAMQAAAAGGLGGGKPLPYGVGSSRYSVCLLIGKQVVKQRSEAVVKQRFSSAEARCALTCAWRTCFTSTSVQILTPVRSASCQHPAAAAAAAAAAASAR